MKISLIITVFNEEGTIKKLIDSLLIQTVFPDEFIIVDAGSQDRTVEIINSYRDKLSKLSLKVYSKKGNRSVGRNYAIKKSSGSIILATDAGCTLDRNWVRNITKPFEDEEIDVVAGFYKARADSIFQKSLATYTCVMPDRVTDDFLPSSRSVAFRRSAWKKVGGYPEELDYCEDLVFARRLKQSGLVFKVVKNALVYWPQRSNIFKAFRQFYNYARGDGEALYIRRATPLLIGRYIVGVFLLIYGLSGNVFMLMILVILFSGYIVWSIAKNYKYVKSVAAFLFLPTLQIVSDIAVIVGMTIGLFSRIISVIR